MTLSRAEILKFMAEIAASSNKKALLGKRGINRSTYYNWLRVVKLHGEAGLVPASEITWTKEELQKINDVITRSEPPSLKDFQEHIPGRSPRAIEGKLKEMGIQLRSIKQSKLRKRQEKRCKKCSRIRPRSDFYTVKKESADGLHVYCKECILKTQSAYREKNPESVKKRGAAYREQRLRSEPDYQNDQSRKWRNTAKGAYATLLSRSKNVSRRGARNFSLSKESFVNWYNSTPKICSYCTITHSEYNVVKKSLGGLAAKVGVMTIDRKDSNQPYSEDNICFSCYLCNQLKGYIFSHDEFKVIALKYIKPKLKKSA